MPQALITSSIIGCNHAGLTVPPLVAGQDVLMVNGQPVVAPSSLSVTFVGCTHTGTNITPCLAIATQTAGNSEVLKINGNPVVLDTAAGTTDSKPDAGSWSVQTVNQDVLQTNG